MTFTINTDICTSCGICKRDCPSKSIDVSGENAAYRIERESCIACAHCYMVCPVNAVFGDGRQLNSTAQVATDEETLPAVLRGRRSVRQYTDVPVSRDIIDALIQEASLTSSGSNAEDWEAAVFSGDAVARVGRKIAATYRRIFDVASLPGIRLLMRLTQVRKYVEDREARRSIRHRIESYFSGEDWLFWDAPAVVMLTYPKTNRHLGTTNCVLAGSRMMNCALSRGLGSCMIGFATIAANALPRIRRALGLPKDRRVGLTFTIGYPAVTYLRHPVRKAMPTVYID